LRTSVNHARSVMPYLQPTVRQLQPLGRRHHSAPVASEEVHVHARAAGTVSPNAKTSAPRRRRRWHRLPARATVSS
jgi:hypothetical protein